MLKRQVPENKEGIPNKAKYTSFADCQEAALAGDPKAQYALAWRYENGLDTQVDLKAAFQWYEKAATQKYIPACVNLVYFCLNGMTDQTARWNEWYSLAVNEALFKQLKTQTPENEALGALAFGLFLHYSREDVTSSDPQTKFHYLKLAGERGHPRAQTELAVLGLQKGEVVSALDFLQKALATGYTFAQQYFQYGLDYLELKATEAQLEQASSIDATGVVNLRLASVYRTGNDRIKKDNAKAFKCYQLAAEKNNVDALVALGECLEYGLGIKQDLGEATKYYKKAAQQNHPIAKARLALATALNSSLAYDAIKLGESIYLGNFSEVFIATFNGMTVAVKKPSNTEYGLEAFKHEVLLLQKMKHKNLIELVGISANPLYIVTKFAKYGSLWDELDKNENLTWGDVFDIAIQIAEGLTEIHKLKLIHGDIKGGNILLDTPTAECKSGQPPQPFSLPESAKSRIPVVKVADLGSAIDSKDNEKTPSRTESLPWMSPGLLATGFATQATDMWAFAMVLVELATRKGPLAECKDDDEIRKKILSLTEDSAEGTLPLPETCPKPFRQFIYSFFKKEGKERPTADQAIQQLKKLKELPEAKQKVPKKT